MIPGVRTMLWLGFLIGLAMFLKGSAWWVMLTAPLIAVALFAVAVIAALTLFVVFLFVLFIAELLE